jgi:hypothetical protein
MFLFELFKKPLSEGGNLQLPTGEAADSIDLLKHNRSYLVTILSDLFVSINKSFASQYNSPLWKPDLLKNNIRDFMSGSSEHFFNIKDIPDEVFVTKKPKVGDIDTQVNKELVPDLTEFLKANTGQTIGPGKLLGYKAGNEQFSSLWELTDPPIKIQIDLEFTKFENGIPREWDKFAHSSSWADLDSSIKGVFHKYLIMSLTSLTTTDFILRTIYKSGKVKDEQTSDNMISFAVSSKEGGGLRNKYAPVIENGEQVIIDGLPVMTKLPATGYSQNLEQIFSIILGKRLPANFYSTNKSKFWSFVGLASIINELLDSAEKTTVVESFINKLFGPAAQGLYRGDPERDQQEKMVALNKLLSIVGVSKPATLDGMIVAYKDKYKGSD